MNIYLKNFYDFSFSLINENFKKNLTHQDKVIIAIASIALGCLTMIGGYLLRHYYFNAKPIYSNVNQLNGCGKQFYPNCLSDQNSQIIESNPARHFQNKSADESKDDSVDESVDDSVVANSDLSHYCTPTDSKLPTPSSEQKKSPWRASSSKSADLKDQSQKHILANGNIYEGLFDDGNLVKGKITFKNGDVHEGLFLEGEHLIQGLITYNKNSTEKLLTAEGIFDPSSAFLIEGTLKYLNGDLVVGNFLLGIGKGKITDPETRHIDEGEFKNSELYEGKRTSFEGESFLFKKGVQA